MFKIEIETGNDAFVPDARGEIMSILELLCADIRRGKEPSALYDANGNKVGKVTWAI